MKNKIDLSIIILCALIIFIAMYGIDDADMRMMIIFIAAITLSIFLFIYLGNASEDRAMKTDDPDFADGSIQELLLLNEEGKPVAAWDIYGKSALVIGRDIKENHVDINLSQSVYASMIDIEHAVLNYTAGNWYIEDLGSKNGIILQKFSDGRKYKLAADQPCKLDKGDTIIIGLTKLNAR